uniref:Piercer of microtubule wall 1 n=1 Tax=Leptobrachium leishanense TaxID=445787 RepID=A0A8C5MNX5_9ANUR
MVTGALVRILTISCSQEPFRSQDRLTVSENLTMDPSPPQELEKNFPKTSDFYRVNKDLPAKFNHPESWRRGYRSKAGNPLYKTTNQTYGSRPPTVHEMPTMFVSKSSKFSDLGAKCGMYRNNGLNVSTEKSYVTGVDNFITAYDTMNFHRSFNMKGPSE